MEVGALDDLHPPFAGGCNSGLHRRSLITAVAIDQRNEGEQRTRAAQHGDDTIAILHVGRMDDDAQREAERIDENMPLAARNLLSRVEALRVERGAPFLAALAVWLSMIAIVGLASRPSRSRVST
jgi:hypothetical protein